MEFIKNNKIWLIGSFLIFFVTGFILLLYADTGYSQDFEGNDTYTKNEMQIGDKDKKDVILKDLSENDNLVNNENVQIIPEQPKEEHDVPFSFVVIGDSEHGRQKFGFDKDVLPIMDIAKSLHPSMVFFTGDIIMISSDSAGKIASVQFVKKTIESYFDKIPYYIVFGNHDLECGVKCVDIWESIFFGKKYLQNEERITYHSFDHENTHFIILSTDYPKENTMDEKQLRWLVEDLEQNTKKNVIILTHVPPVTFFDESAKKCHDFGCQPELQGRLLAIFKKYHVDLVISGHENAFDHKIVDGVNFILSGNATGSRPRYKGVTKRKDFSQVLVNGKSIIVHGIDSDGKVFREIFIK